MTHRSHAGSGSRKFNVPGTVCSATDSTVAKASNAPAAPIMWPVIDFVPEIASDRRPAEHEPVPGGVEWARVGLDRLTGPGRAHAAHVGEARVRPLEQWRLGGPADHGDAVAAPDGLGALGDVVRASRARRDDADVVAD